MDSRRDIRMIVGLFLLVALGLGLAPVVLDDDLGSTALIFFYLGAGMCLVQAAMFYAFGNSQLEKWEGFDEKLGATSGPGPVFGFTSRRGTFELDGRRGFYEKRQKGKYASEFRIGLPEVGNDREFRLVQYESGLGYRIGRGLGLLRDRDDAGSRWFEEHDVVGYPASVERLFEDRSELRDPLEALFEAGFREVACDDGRLWASGRVGWVRGNLQANVENPDEVVRQFGHLVDFERALPSSVPDARRSVSPFRWILGGGFAKFALTTIGVGLAAFILLITPIATGVISPHYPFSFFMAEGEVKWAIDTQSHEVAADAVEQHDYFGHNVLPQRTGNVRTPLHYAIKEDRPETALELVERGAHVDASEEDGDTPLHLAAERKQIELARTLLEHGADPNRANDKARTPLHFAVREASLELVKLLLEAGAEPDPTDGEGMTPLYWIADSDRTACAEVLLRHGADPNRTNAQGWTPLDAAVDEGAPSMVETLLEHGADPNRTGPGGLEPLHRATRRDRRFEVMETLLEHGADIDAADRKGITLRDWAERTDDDELRKFVDEWKSEH